MVGTLNLQVREKVWDRLQQMVIDARNKVQITKIKLE